MFQLARRDIRYAADKARSRCCPGVLWEGLASVVGGDDVLNITVNADDGCVWHTGWQLAGPTTAA